jgi:hypothetical protein
MGPEPACDALLVVKEEEHMRDRRKDHAQTGRITSEPIRDDRSGPQAKVINLRERLRFYMLTEGLFFILVCQDEHYFLKF